MLHAVLGRDVDAAALIRRVSASLNLAAPHFSTREIADEDWVRKTQAQFAPIEIGTRLWVGPTWHRAPAGRAAVQLDPGLAFGTGTHPTTRLVLAYLDSRVRGGERVLDYGCGSGILAIAAAKLGAQTVDAVDLDPEAVETTRVNAAANAVAVNAALPDALAAAHYDIAVSNILAQPLIVLAPLLAQRAERLALAGVLEAQAAEVSAAYRPWLDLRVTGREDGWVLLSGARR
jgi:ribosomal protein L11 methyltransferase